MKTTGWYEIWQRPVRVGYYDCTGSCGPHWWTGRKWQWSRKDDSSVDPFRWRGLTEKAK